MPMMSGGTRIGYYVNRTKLGVIGISAKDFGPGGHFPLTHQSSVPAVRTGGAITKEEREAGATSIPVLGLNSILCAGADLRLGPGEMFVDRKDGISTIRQRPGRLAGTYMRWLDTPEARAEIEELKKADHRLRDKARWSEFSWVDVSQIENPKISILVLREFTEVLTETTAAHADAISGKVDVVALLAENEMIKRDAASITRAAVDERDALLKAKDAELEKMRMQLDLASKASQKGPADFAAAAGHGGATHKK